MPELEDAFSERERALLRMTRSIAQLVDRLQSEDCIRASLWGVGNSVWIFDKAGQGFSLY